MAINELHQEYPNKNAELRSVAKQTYEFGQTIAQEASSGHTNGLDEHAIRRQRSYIEHAKSLVDAINAKPIPDLPATNPTQMPIDFSVPYVYTVIDLEGNEVPMNEACQILAEKWLIISVELAKSNSAGLGGSLVSHDYERAVNNIAALEQILDEYESRPFLDLPETADPGAAQKPRTGGKK